MVGERRIEANGLAFAIDEAGSGDTAALLLHGFPESRVAWRGVMEPLAERLGWHVVAPDLRGYGESSRPPGKSAYEMRHLAADVEGMFEVLKPRRRILVGHDWGGIVAWQVALRRRVPLDGLVIVNAPHPAVFARELKNGWRQRARSWYVLFFQLPLVPEAMLTSGNGRGVTRLLEGQSRAFPRDVLDIYRRNVVAPGAASAMLNYYRANLAGPARMRGSGGRGKITVPTLMIWGEEDKALDIRLTEGNEKHVEDLTLNRLPGVTHWVMHEAGAEVVEAVAAWADRKQLAAQT